MNPIYTCPVAQDKHGRCYWKVFLGPLIPGNYRSVAAADVAGFAKLYPMNARPVQKDFRRFVPRS